MQTVISIANKKGGTGKSTVATNLACVLAASGSSTVLIDADEQQSSMSFQEGRPDTAVQFQVVSLPTKTILREAKKFNANNIIIDVPAKDSPVSRASMAAADLVIVPVQPSQYDILATEDTFQLLDQIAAQKERYKIGVVKNMVLPNPRIKLSGEVDTILCEMAKEYGLHIFETSLYSRLAYKESAEQGLAVTEMTGRKYEKASAEFTGLVKEIYEWSV